MVVETTNKNGIKKQCGHTTLAIDQTAITDTSLIQYQTHIDLIDSSMYIRTIEFKLWGTSAQIDS